MSNYEKQNFVSNQILKAEHMNHIEDGIKQISLEVADRVSKKELSEAVTSSLLEAKESGIFDGAQGVGIKTIEYDEVIKFNQTPRDVTFVLTDDQRYTIQIFDGLQGVRGPTGPAGVGISSVHTEVEDIFENITKTTINFTDGSSFSVKDGKNGKTPVKGTDYWTLEDQEAIIQQVLERLASN